MIISRVLAMGERSAIGLYDVLLFLFLLGLRMGIIFAVFHVCGIMLVFSALLYRRVSAAIAVGPRCFMCVFERLSGPADFLGFACFMAVLTSSCVIVICVVGRFLMCRVIFL